MKATVTKEYKFCTVIKLEDLMLINDFLKSEYDSIKYKMYTNNDAVYELDDFEEIINYDNPDSRKITKIYIAAYKAPSYFPNFEISLADIEYYRISVSYTIQSIDNKEIDSLLRKISDWNEWFKKSYSWIYHNDILIFWVIWAPVSLLFYFTSFKQLDKVTYYVANFSLSWIVSWIIMLIIDKLLPKLYPKTTFCIGKQKQRLESKQKLRSNILWSGLVTFIIGVLTSFFVYLLTK